GATQAHLATRVAVSRNLIASALSARTANRRGGSRPTGGPAFRVRSEPMKGAVEDLAILGGSPAFPEPLHVGRPNLGSRDGFDRRTQEIFARRWLTNDGPFVREFEERVAESTG